MSSSHTPDSIREAAWQALGALKSLGAQDGYAAKALAEALERDPTPVSNMSVTPLEWNGNSGRAVMGSYRVSYNVSGQPWGYPERGAGFYAERDIGFGQLVSGPHETRKEAEQSADLDYERHILSALSATATGPTPAPSLGLRYRPNEFDDWGQIRTPDGHIFASVRRPASEEELSEHRAAATDPYEDMARRLMASYDGPDPKSVGLLREALARMENCFEYLAATRTHEIYTAMIDGGQTQALLDLDAARRNAREVLSATATEGERP